jgi:hypothetical protein
VSAWIPAAARRRSMSARREPQRRSPSTPPPGGVVCAAARGRIHARQEDSCALPLGGRIRARRQKFNREKPSPAHVPSSSTLSPTHVPSSLTPSPAHVPSSVGLVLYCRGSSPCCRSTEGCRGTWRNTCCRKSSRSKGGCRVCVYHSFIVRLSRYCI